MEKCYKVLDVRPDATPEEIRQAYHDLIRVWNPDRFSDDKRLQEKAKRRLNEIISAYTAIAMSKSNLNPQPSVAESTKPLLYSPPARPVVVGAAFRKGAPKEGKAAIGEDKALAFAAKVLRAMLVAFMLALPVSLYFFVTRGGIFAIASFVAILAVVIPFMLRRRRD